MIASSLDADLSSQSKNKSYPQNSSEGYIGEEEIKPRIGSATLAMEGKNFSGSYNWFKSPDNDVSMQAEKDSDPKILPLHRKIRESKKRRPSRTLNPIKEWEGYIESISENEFTSKMVAIDSKSPIPTDLVTFSKDEVSEDDQELLKVGAFLRWVIGYEKLREGQVRKVSELYFRRLPIHSDKDYRRSLKKAEDIIASINWLDETET